MDFLKSAQALESVAVKSLQDLLKIPSVFDADTIGPGAPFGKAISDALEYVLKLAKGDGFQTVNDAGYAAHIEYGGTPDAPILGILCHLDVVPVGAGWNYPPFGAEINGRQIYARGAMDDKGPTIAAYYALKLLKDLQVPLKKRVRIILGTDEETGWRGIEHYFKKYEMPELGFAPDADFPLIYSEKGILRLDLERKFPDEELQSFRAGERYNIVIDEATATTVSDFRGGFTDYLQANGLTGETTSLTEQGKTVYRYTMRGLAAHAMEPEKGINAGTHLANYLSQSITNPLLNFVADYLHDDVNLKKLGLFHENAELGLLTCNVGIIHIDRLNGRVGLDLRYPQGFDSKQAQDLLMTKLKPYNLSLTVKEDKVPHYQPLDSLLVQTLWEVYQKYSGDLLSRPKAIGGGTYARALKLGVAFGMEMPNVKSLAHQADEMLNIDNFLMAIAIYAEAIFRLGS